ncbi:MAG TPA: hypothetical protein VFR15_17410 [Chloroflexia bacterium]|nr:hypothetical protein [Chloroflexia bacterium]
MEFDELEPTGYFSEFSWISNEDEEEDTVAVLDGADIFAAPLPDPVTTAEVRTMPVLEQQGAPRS